MNKRAHHRKKTKRGKKKKRSIMFYYNNINGIKSKYTSLVNIIKRQVKPEVFAICETKLNNQSKLRHLFPDYELVTRTCKQGKGGLLIAVQRNVFMNVVGVTSSLSKNILVARLVVSPYFAVRLILVYGPQETESVEEREFFMMEVSIEIQKCVDNGDVPMVIGDFNAKVEKVGDSVVPVSPNGKLMMSNVVQEHGLNIVNFTDKCIGKWTHVVRTTDEKSILDYLIVPKVLLDSIDEMVIDEDCSMCPFVSRRKGSEVTYSDHNACSISAAIVIPRKVKNTPEYKWKFDENSLNQIKEMTKSGVFHPPSLSGDVQHDYNGLENELNKLMSATCRKQKRKSIKSHKVKTKFVQYISWLSKYGTRGKEQRKVVKLYKDMIMELNREEEGKERARNLSKTIKTLTVNGNFSPNEFWKLKESVLKKVEEVSSVIDPESGVELFGEGVIKEAYMKEFKSRLEHRKIDPSLRTYEEKTNFLAHQYVAKAALKKGPPITVKELEDVTKDLKDGKCAGSDNIPPEVYKMMSNGMKAYIVDIMNEVKEQLVIPSQWQETLITTIFKNKGSRKYLKNYRGIFLTQIISKLYEKIHVKRVENILAKVSKLQAGSKKNRGPPDNLFLVKSCIDHACYLNAPIYMTVYDFEQCFDALWLEESIVALWNLGIRDETLSIIYEMNKQTMVKVKTPYGTCEGFSRPTVVKQGTVFGPVICSTSTAVFVHRNREARGFQIGNMSINTVILVDDVGNINGDVVGVIKSHDNMNDFSRLKRLPLGGIKCFLLPINCRNKELPILKIGSHSMEVKDKIIYLGAFFNRRGTNKDLIDDRIQKGRTCMVNSIAMCSDITLGAYDIPSLILVYNSAFVSTLLYGCQFWTRVLKNEEKRLTTIQLQFLKQILRVPRSTCNCYVYLELGVLPIVAIIHIRKLTFLHHILCLENDDPVQRAYLQQLTYIAEKNWANECNELRETYRIDENDEEIASVSKKAWKRRVKKKVREKVLQDLNEERLTMKKVSKTKAKENMNCREYLKKMRSDQARLVFRVRSRMTLVKEHRKYDFKEDNMQCRLCDMEPETLEHVMHECPGLREKPVDAGTEYSEDLKTLEMVAARLAEFGEKVWR